MVIGFMFIGGALGESAIGIESFYAIKKVYECRLVIFTSKIMQNLLKYCKFVDIVTDISTENINLYNCDYLILSNSKTCFIQNALKTNAKKIICATKIVSFLSSRCKTVPIYTFKKYYMLDERQILLEYVRRIDRKLYDNKMQYIDLNCAKVKTSSTNQKHILSFLETSLNNILESSGIKQPYLIAINPFNNACPYSLTLNGFLLLIHEVSKIPNCIPCVATYPQVDKYFIEQWTAFKKHINDSRLNNVVIFHNDNDLLNLAEFINQMSCVISPSTGTIHLACNLRIPTIALYPQYDTRRWATHNKKYVFIDSKKDLITLKEEENIVKNTINMLMEMIEEREIKTTCILLK